MGRATHGFDANGSNDVPAIQASTAKVQKLQEVNDPIIINSTALTLHSTSTLLLGLDRWHWCDTERNIYIVQM